MLNQPTVIVAEELADVYFGYFPRAVRVFSACRESCKVVVHAIGPMVSRISVTMDISINSFQTKAVSQVGVSIDPISVSPSTLCLEGRARKGDVSADCVILAIRLLHVDGGNIFYVRHLVNTVVVPGKTKFG